MTNFRTPSFWDRRPGESEYAHAARVRPYLHHREDAQAEADAGHAQFRAQQEQRTSGEGYGLAGDLTPQERAQAVKAAGVQAGEQRIAGNGHLSWEANRNQPGLARVYRSQLEQTSELPGSPLARYLRGDMSQDSSLPVHERWS